LPFSHISEQHVSLLVRHVPSPGNPFPFFVSLSNFTGLSNLRGLHFLGLFKLSAVTQCRRVACLTWFFDPVPSRSPTPCFPPVVSARRRRLRPFDCKESPALVFFASGTPVPGIPPLLEEIPSSMHAVFVFAAALRPLRLPFLAYDTPALSRDQLEILPSPRNDLLFRSLFFFYFAHPLHLE